MHSSLPRQLVNFRFGANRVMIAIFEHLERLVINTCDAMITIGPDLQAYVRGINPDVPLMMIENLPLEQNPPEPGEIRRLRENLGLEGKLAIVYAGTFERYQGVDLLLEGGALLKDRYPRVVYVLVGGKPDQVAAFQSMAEKLDLAHRVHFTGTLSVAEANQFIAMADILASPRIEGTSVPLKIYTYLKAGKPIIATNLPAHTLVLDHKTAMLVEPEKEAFAAGLARLIEDEPLRQQLATQSLRLAEEKYSQASYLSRLAEIYQVLQSGVRSEKSMIEPVKE
jgi:glycosyltransferase involved in cell wall biosynthesis